jgi:hypothetical protein
MHDLHGCRVLRTRLQVQRSKHGVRFVFSAYGRKSTPPALRVVFDSELPEARRFDNINGPIVNRYPPIGRSGKAGNIFSVAVPKLCDMMRK